MGRCVAAQACFGKDTSTLRGTHAPQVWRQLKSPHRIVAMEYDDVNCGTGGGDKVNASCLLLIQFPRAHTLVERAWRSSSLDVKRAAIGCGGRHALGHASTAPKCFGAFDALADALVQRAGSARAAFMPEGMSAGVIDFRCWMMTIRVLSLAGVVLREPHSDPKSKVKRGCEHSAFLQAQRKGAR